MFLRLASHAALTAWLFCTPLPLRADSEVTANISTPVGYDSNALLEVNPAGTTAAARGYYIGAEGALALRLSTSGGWEAFAVYDGDHRYAGPFGNLLWHTLEAGAARQKAANRLELAWLAVQFVAPRFDSDEFAGTGPRVAASLGVSDRFRLRLDAGTQVRRSDASTQGYSHASASLRYLFAPRASAGVSAQSAWLGNAWVATQPLWQRHRLAPFVRLSATSWALWAAPFLGVRTLSNDTAGQAGVVAHVQRPLVGGFVLRAAVDFTREWGPASAGRADRLDASLGLTWQATTVIKARAADDDDVRPLVSGRGVRFRVRAPGARQAVLIGSFDNWGDGLPMTLLPNHENMWEVSIAVPPCGPLRYRFLIDDVPQTPPQAPRYVADGFGGRDGEVTVPESTCSRKETAEGVSSPKVRSF